MKLYLDTADRGAAESLMATGLLAPAAKASIPPHRGPALGESCADSSCVINKDAKRAITKATVDATRVTV